VSHNKDDVCEKILYDVSRLLGVDQTQGTMIIHAPTYQQRGEST